MYPKTATFFSLALFPQAFLFQRALAADILFVMSSRRLDNHNRAHQCFIRPAAGPNRKIEIAVQATEIPLEDVVVQQHTAWFPAMEQQVGRAYRGLPLASAACTLVSESMSLNYASPWLIDYLMQSLVHTLDYLAWNGKVVRCPTVGRRCFANDAEYLLGLCLADRCTQLLVGNGPEITDREYFRKNKIKLISQQWHSSPTLRARDSIVDAIARLPVTDLRSLLRK